MLKVSCVLLVVVLCSLSTADQTHVFRNDKDKLLQNEGFGINQVAGESEEPKYKEKSMCYDEDNGLAYKVDATWYVEGKCEQRVCSRLRDSKTPTTKIMECEPCLTCDSPDKKCHPFRPEKKFPKCCPQCLSKSAALGKKSHSGSPLKKYKLH